MEKIKKTAAAITILVLSLTAVLVLSAKDKRDYSNLIKVLDSKLLAKTEEVGQERHLREAAEEETNRLKTELSSVKKSLKEVNEKFEKQAPELKSRVQEFQSQIDGLTEGKKQLLDKLNNLEKQMDRTSRNKDRMDKVQEENKHLNLKLRKLKSEFNKVSAQKRKLDYKIEKLSNIQDKVKELEEKNSEIEEAKDVLIREAVILRATIAELKSQFLRTEQELSEAREEAESSRIKVGLRAETILVLTEEKKALLKKLEQKEEEVSAKIKRMQGLEKEFVKLQNEYKTQKEQITKLSGENQQMKGELQDFQLRYKNISQVLGDVSDTNAQLQKKITSLDQILDNSKTPEVKDAKSVIDLGKMKVKDAGPEVTLSSLIYQFRKMGENAPEEEKHAYLRKEAFTHYNLGVYYLKQDNYQGALGEFLKAHEILPEDTDAIYNIALIYRYYIYDYDKARYYFKKYLELAADARDKEKVKELLQETP